MPPLTLTLNLSAEIDPPIAGPEAAHQLGREIARLADAQLAGTSMAIGTGRVTWTVLRHKPDDGNSYALLDLERAVHTVVRQTDGWEGARIQTIDLRARTNDEVARQVAQPSIPDLVGVDEFAELLGVNRSRFYVLRDRPGFPTPIAKGVYLKVMAEQYAQERAEQLGRQSVTEE